jgi:hypothetical protein
VPVFFRANDIGFGWYKHGHIEEEGTEDNPTLFIDYSLSYSLEISTASVIII